MGMITQEAYFRQRVLNYAAKHGVTAAAIQYHMSRKTVHKWKKRYDGAVESLQDLPRTPHHFPRQQTADELKLVKRYAKKCKGDPLLGYENASKHGYHRSYGYFKKTARKLLQPEAKKRKKRKNKPYQRAEYPGQKMYAEHSTASAKDFLEKLVRAAPFPIRMVQTDNGTEFTNALLVTKSKHKTLFEEALMEMGIEYHRIRIATPRHNGKVERQHRIDEQRFYKQMRMFSLADGRKQLAVYQRASNDHIMTCLGMKSPNQVLAQYQGVMW